MLSKYFFQILHSVKHIFKKKFLISRVFHHLQKEVTLGDAKRGKVKRRRQFQNTKYLNNLLISNYEKPNPQRDEFFFSN